MKKEKTLFRQINKKPVSVYEKVMKEIKSAVLEGRLKPGDRLPPERELAGMLGVSRTSLREALKILELSGIVSIKHGQGVFITNGSSDEYIQKLLKQVIVDNKKIEDFFQIRKVLETQAVVWACRRGSDEEITKILELLEETKRSLEQKDSDYIHLLAAQDSDFHQLVIAAAKNSVLVMIMQTLLELFADSRVKTISVPGRPEKSLEEHLAIAKALKNRDEKLAREAMLKHLENVERDIFADNKNFGEISALSK